jgi:spore coat protein U-like protein
MFSRVRPNVWFGVAVISGSFLAAGPAAAQAQSEKLQVQAFIGELCSVTSATLDFGTSVDPAFDTDADGSILINCATETTLEVELDGGLHFNDSSGARAMTPTSGTGSDLLYTLYKNVGRTTIWQPGERVSATITGDGSVPVYGRVLSQSNGHSSGLHTDEVTITLVF